eukprot:TRINITY_DN2343_c0_g1_i2.p2 TRINITY_DN2343_c0_g1~~TRINITY_DN2343_c0_g1_i2.p2  ORF type:complete len:491 (+),score=139.02 TRINITY_DN2343_c0_g1_i2:2698-4170(+)
MFSLPRVKTKSKPFSSPFSDSLPILKHKKKDKVMKREREREENVEIQSCYRVSSLRNVEECTFPCSSSEDELDIVLVFSHLSIVDNVVFHGLQSPFLEIHCGEDDSMWVPPGQEGGREGGEMSEVQHGKRVGGQKILFPRFRLLSGEQWGSGASIRVFRVQSSKFVASSSVSTSFLRVKLVNPWSHVRRDLALSQVEVLGKNGDVDVPHIAQPSLKTFKACGSVVPIRSPQSMQPVSFGKKDYGHEVGSVSETAEDQSAFITDTFEDVLEVEDDMYPHEKGEAETNEEMEEGLESLKKVVFSLSGFQNPKRSHMRKKGLEMGWKYAPDIDDRVTHLIAAFQKTKKCREAEVLGVRIVDEDWLDRMFSQFQSAKEEEAKELPSTSDPSWMEKRQNGLMQERLFWRRWMRGAGKTSFSRGWIGWLEMMQSCLDQLEKVDWNGDFHSHMDEWVDQWSFRCPIPRLLRRIQSLEELNVAKDVYTALYAEIKETI